MKYKKYKWMVLVGLTFLLLVIPTFSVLANGSQTVVEDFSPPKLEWRTYGAEVDDYPDVWGPPDPEIPGWKVVEDADCTGGYCMQSGRITHLQVSVLEITLDFKEEGSVYYRLRGSSERFIIVFDGLMFYIDDELVDFWGGGPPDRFSPWAEARHDVPAGEHTFRWVYVKDESDDYGLDAFQLDIVQFEGVEPPYSYIPLTPDVLTSGTIGPLEIQTPGSETQYGIEVDEGVRILAIGLRSETGGNLDLHIRFRRPVERSNNVVIADYSLVSPHGEEIFILYDPQPGVYYIAVENREETEQKYTIVAIPLPAIKEEELPAEEEGAVIPPSLAELIPYLRTERGQLGLWQYKVEVPEGAESLEIRLEGLEGKNVDLHIRYGEPVEIKDGKVVADLSSISLTGEEAVVISGEFLKPGTYYIAVEGLEPPQEFKLTVTIDYGGGHQTAALTPFEMV